MNVFPDSLYRPPRKKNGAEKELIDCENPRDDVRDLLSPNRIKAKEILRVLTRTRSARAVLEIAREMTEPLDLNRHVTRRRKKEVDGWYDDKIKFLVYDRLLVDGCAPEAKEIMELLGQGINFDDTVKKAYSKCIEIGLSCTEQIKKVFPHIDFDS